MTWHGKHVLVTGAGGFIGSHLVERLVDKGARVRAMCRYSSNAFRGWLADSKVKADIEFVFGDVADRDSVERAVRGQEIVFHLAALIGIPYSYDAPGAYVRTNIIGTLNVLTASRHANVERVLHTSTSEVYGSAQYVPMNEDHPVVGQSPYSATKIGADQLVVAFHRSFGLPASIVRPFNTYGPRQSSRAVIPAIITQCMKGNQVRLGNLNASRDLNFVLDTADGFLAVAESPRTIGETVNLGSGREIDIRNLALTIARLTGREIEFVVEEHRLRPEASEVDRLLADNSRAKLLTSWNPKVPLEKGLELTVDWFRSNHVPRDDDAQYRV